MGGFRRITQASRLPGFYAAHPDISLRVISSVWDLDFGAGDADLDIRYGDGNWPGVRCERLDEDAIFPVASPAVAAELQADPTCLANARLLHTVGFQVGWPDWLASAGLGEMVDGNTGDHFDTAILPLYLAEQGSGLALARRSFVSGKLEVGTLVAPFETVVDTEEAFYLVHPTDAHPGGSTAIVSAWLTGETMG